MWMSLRNREFNYHGLSAEVQVKVEIEAFDAYYIQQVAILCQSAWCISLTQVI